MSVSIRIEAGVSFLLCIAALITILSAGCRAGQPPLDTVQPSSHATIPTMASEQGSAASGGIPAPVPYTAEPRANPPPELEETASTATPPSGLSQESNSTIAPYSPTTATPSATRGPELVSVRSAVQHELKSESKSTRPEESIAKPQQAMPGDVDRVVRDINEFAFDLYPSLSREGQNLFYSPYSITLALAMAYAGARGETEIQMAQTLYFDVSQEQLHPVFSSLGLSLTGHVLEPNGDEALLKMASSVWTQPGHDLAPGFLDTLAANYAEQVWQVDFRREPEAAAGQINDWAADETNGRIKHLVSPAALSEITRMIIANVIYFRAPWQHVFDDIATRDRAFHLLNGSERPVPMMRLEERLRYGTGDNYQAVELSYRGQEMVMIILLPEDGKFDEFEGSLSGDSVTGILDNLDYALVSLTMPRFEMESAFRLSDTLSDMGMPDAFDGRAANFSGMGGPRCRPQGDSCLFISDVLHKTFISVNEAGTEAAAATTTSFSLAEAEEPELTPVDVVVDRPFLFVIHHRSAQVILFVGRVLDP